MLLITVITLSIPLISAQLFPPANYDYAPIVPLPPTIPAPMLPTLPTLPPLLMKDMMMMDKKDTTTPTTSCGDTMMTTTTSNCAEQPACGCMCGRNGRKKRSIEEGMDEDGQSLIKCTNIKMKKLIVKAIKKDNETDGISFDFGNKKLTKYVFFCQEKEFDEIQLATDSSDVCRIRNGHNNCIIIQH